MPATAPSTTPATAPASMGEAPASTSTPTSSAPTPAALATTPEALATTPMALATTLVVRAKGGNKGGPGPGGSDDSAGAGISTGKLAGCAVHAPTTASVIGRVNRALGVNRALDVNRALARVPWAIIATSGSMAPSSAICACVSGLSSAMSERAAAAISGCPRFGLTSHETKAEIAPAFATSSAAPARSASSPSVVAARTLALGLPWRSSWHKGSIPPPSLMACRLDPRIIRGHQRSSEVIRGHQRSSDSHQRS